MKLVKDETDPLCSTDMRRKKPGWNGVEVVVVDGVVGDSGDTAAVEVAGFDV